MWTNKNQTQIPQRVAWIYRTTDCSERNQRRFLISGFQTQYWRTVQFHQETMLTLCLILQRSKRQHPALIHQTVFQTRENYQLPWINSAQTYSRYPLIWGIFFVPFLSFRDDLASPLDTLFIWKSSRSKKSPLLSWTDSQTQENQHIIAL